MKTERITPILNVSNLAETLTWFEKLGWKDAWQWGEPASFGGVCSGECEIFFCVDGQGGRGKGKNTSTFGPGSNESADQGTWMSLWVEDADEAHATCVANNIEITWPVSDMPWGVREFHIRHPDGHVFRISQAANQTD